VGILLGWCLTCEELVGKTFGNEKLQPKYEGKITNMKPTRLSSIHDVGKSSF